VKWSFWFVTYNGMGGHPVLSFAPDVLMAFDRKSFGGAIGEIEIYAHIEPARSPLPTSDFLMARFRDRLHTLPKAWFRRKAKRVEIAYHSQVGCAEDLLGADFATMRVPDTGLLRRTCAEVAASLLLLAKCVKRSDDFDVGGFLGYVDAKILELSAFEDSELLHRLAEVQAAERERVTRESNRENQKQEARKGNRKTEKPKMPRWRSPKNIAKELEAGDGVWEDQRWSPVLLTAITGTEYEGREIPVAWQIEFDPSDEALGTANTKLSANGVTPDGYGWGEFIQKTIRKANPALAKRLHNSDCELATCVIWVESEDDCRTVLEATWRIFFEG